jgi:hypothetical protein
MTEVETSTGDDQSTPPVTTPDAGIPAGGKRKPVFVRDGKIDLIGPGSINLR